MTKAHHFAARTAWPRTPNAWTRARASARVAIDWTVSNPTQVGLPFDWAPALRALHGPAAHDHVPEPFGASDARLAVSEYYQRRGITVDPERIALVASSSEAYRQLFCLLADPGDTVLVPSPSYPLFEYLADLADVKVAPYELGFDGRFFLDRAALDTEDARRAKVVLTVSPNNPTGTVFDPAERSALLDRIQERGQFLISDEVFADYLAGDRAVGHRRATLLGQQEVPTFVLGGLSKAAGLPQLKLSWIVLDGPESTLAEAKWRLEIVLDTYLSVGAPVQGALRTILEATDSFQDTLRARLDTNRAALEARLRGTALGALPGDGGWNALIRLPNVRTDEEWALVLLEQDGLLVQPGYLFDCEPPALISVSLLTPEAQFSAALEGLVQRVAREARA